MKKYIPQGTITALVTPFQKGGAVDFEALKDLIEFQIQGGVDAIVVCGSTGESATLTINDKIAIFKKSIEYAGGKIPIIAGTGSNETEGTLNLSTIAFNLGVTGLLLVAPYYNKPTQDGLYEHFKLVADNVDIPVIIYNVPGRTGVNISAETQLKLAKTCKNIVATKEASGNFEQMMKIIKDAPEGFNLLSGDDIFTLPIIAFGGKGVVSVISNYAPKQFSEMVKNAMNGIFDKARKIHYELMELMELNFIESNPIPVKYALALMKKIDPVYRLPLLEMTKKNKDIFKKAMQNAGLI
ncbi:MAG: 4-hydroxy-tetrahydrodipicolinate synthase [Candidatus Kapabacteria bacterium]|nr:4-hydroxy-tetrahydrodipicolinate synthase [Candidatus Kapabacteria bacterium]